MESISPLLFAEKVKQFHTVQLLWTFLQLQWKQLEPVLLHTGWPLPAYPYSFPCSNVPPILKENQGETNEQKITATKIKGLSAAAAQQTSFPQGQKSATVSTRAGVKIGS